MVRSAHLADAKGPFRKPQGSIRSHRKSDGLAIILALIAASAEPALGDSRSHQTQQEKNTPTAKGSSLSRYKEEHLAKVMPYRDDRRWQTYLAISDVFDRLWHRPSRISTIRNGRAESLPGFPLLSLEDRDSDGKAEFFTYRPPDGSDRTQEFGAHFDLNSDGRPDWIVYYGGIVLTKEGNRLAPFIYNFNAMDTNGDGKFDIMVTGPIDMDGDGLPERGVTAWICDTDFDGLIDKAEHIVGGSIMAIEPQSGSLPIRRWGHSTPSEQPKVGETMPVELFALVANDIAALSGH